MDPSIEPATPRATVGRSRALSVSPFDEHCDMEGFLTKMGGFIKSWKRRWFTLKYGVLRYFKEGELKKPIKSLYLGAVQSCEICQPEELPPRAPTKHCFQLVYTPHKRTYFFCSTTKEEMHIWVASIQRYLQSDSPKNEKEASKNYAKALDGNPSSHFQLSIDSLSEASETTSASLTNDEDSWGDIFSANKMRFSYAPKPSSSSSIVASGVSFSQS